MESTYLTSEYLVHSQFAKLTDLYLVYKGSLALTLPQFGKVTKFEKLTSGSSLG